MDKISSVIIDIQTNEIFPSDTLEVLLDGHRRHIQTPYTSAPRVLSSTLCWGHKLAQAMLM